MDATKIKNLKDGETLWDTDIKGLHARGFKSGPRYYLSYKSPNGRTRRPSLGPCNVLSLKQARTLAKQMLAEVCLGVDPKEKDRKAKGENLIKDLWPEVFEAHYAKDRFQKSGWAREVQAIFNRNICPAFGTLKPAQVTTAEIRAWHESMPPTTANRALSVFSKFFDVLFSRITLEEGRANPCAYVNAHKERQRVRFLSSFELGKLGAILQREEASNSRNVAFLYLLALTGSRPSAIARSTWSDVEILEHGGQEIGILQIDGKMTESTGQKDTIILNSFLLNFLRGLPARKDGSLTGIKRVCPVFWDKVRKEIGSPDLWARDLRRTFATVGMSQGVGVDNIGRILNHTSYQTTLRYAKLDERVRVSSSALISASVMSQMRGAE